MRKLLWAVSALTIVGCQPPPEITSGGSSAGEPAVSVAYPPSAVDGEAFEVNLSELACDIGTDTDPDLVDCWIILVAIDLDNFDMVSPYVPENAENQVGQGHWHLESDPHNDPSAEYEILTTEQSIGDTVTLEVTLRNNDHTPYIGENGGVISATVEVKLAGAL